MAENADGQERSEQPTGKRLGDARAKGQVARSRELVITVSLVGSAVGFYVFGRTIIDGLMAVMHSNFSLPRDQMFDPKFMLFAFQDSLSTALFSLGPFLALLVAVIVAGSIALSGWNFSVQALQPKFSKLNPLNGIKRIFGPQGLMELCKAVAKFFVITGVGIYVLYSIYEYVLALGVEPVKQAIVHSGDLIIGVFFAVGLSTAIIAMFDVPFQLWNHKRQLKMTKQEVKQEHKDTDGNPEVKRRIRQVQFEAAMRRMMEAIPQADVVITNPTHFAVAVKYDQDNMRAPIVVAKGADYVAFEIRRIAQENDVPIMSAPPLARAIYHTTELDQEIPEGLYVAVARVLAYIFHIRRKDKNYRQENIDLDDLPIPDDMQYDSDGKV